MASSKSPWANASSPRRTEFSSAALGEQAPIARAAARSKRMGGVIGRAYTSKVRTAPPAPRSPLGATLGGVRARTEGCQVGPGAHVGRVVLQALLPLANRFGVLPQTLEHDPQTDPGSHERRAGLE